MSSSSIKLSCFPGIIFQIMEWLPCYKKIFNFKHYFNIIDVRAKIIFRILWRTCTLCMDTATHPAQPVQGSMSTMPLADGNILTDWKWTLFAKIIRNKVIFCSYLLSLYSES